MTPETRSEPEVAPAANGAPREPDFLSRARRVLAGGARPEDYLPVTPEIRLAVGHTMAGYRERGRGQELAPQVEPRQLLDELLAFHHGGRLIVFTQDAAGVVVLGVGDQIGAILAALGPTHAARLVVDTPPARK